MFFYSDYRKHMKCPLCNKKLLKIDMLADYICPTRVAFSNNHETTHYELRDYGLSGAISIWYLPPYHIINIGDRSTIYLYNTDDNQVISMVPFVRRVLDVPAIPPDSPEKLIKRIRNLIIFS